MELNTDTQATAIMLPEGITICNGKYQIQKHIASGGFGNTYKAIDTQSGKLYAIKEFFIKGDTHREGTTSKVSVSNTEKTAMVEDLKNKFRREAKRLMSIDNPHIVKVFDTFDENDTAYYVMEYIDGESLSMRMKSMNRPFNDAEAMNLLNQMLEALQTIHSDNLLHLDIKPSNIMIDNKGIFKLIDFGASKQTDPSAAATLSSAVCYTQGYAPPEQISGNKKNWGPWTDLYALGATLYNVVSGNKPPMNDEILSEGDKAFKYPMPLSSNIIQLISWMMRLQPNKRPQNTGEIRAFINWTSQNQNQAAGPQRPMPPTPPVMPVPPVQPQQNPPVAPGINQTYGQQNTVYGPQPQHQQNQYPPASPIQPPMNPQNTKRGGNKVITALLIVLIVALLAFLGYLLYKNSQDEKRAEIAKIEAQKSREKAEKKRKEAEAEEQRLEEERLAEEQRQAEIEAEAQRQAEIERERQAALAQQAAISGSYYISGTLNGDDVDFDVYVYDDGSVSGTFTNYSMGTGWDVGGTMKANSFSFYSIDNSVNWKFNASRSGGNSFTGTCSNGSITYSMYLDVERQ